MFIAENKIKLVGLSVSVLLLSSIKFGASGPLTTGDRRDFSIDLKAKAIVIGPNITLGDIGQVTTHDSTLRSQLSSIQVGQAPPPGESSEIRLNHIKRCLKKAGFGEFIDTVKGPRIIRVTTAQIEIDKAFIKEEYAAILGNHWTALTVSDEGIELRPKKIT